MAKMQSNAKRESILKETKPERQYKKGSRFLAWLISFASIPTVIIIMMIWYVIACWILTIIGKIPVVAKLLGFADDVISGAAGTGVLGLLATIALNRVVQALINRSQSIRMTRRGGRFILTGILGVISAVAVPVIYYLNQAEIESTYHLVWMQIFYVVYGLIVISFSLLKSAIMLYRSSKAVNYNRKL